LQGERKRRSFRRFTQKLGTAHSIDGFLDTSRWTQSATTFSRALFDAVEAYVPETYDGQILAYVAKTQPLTHLFQVAATWTKICGRVEIAKVPGTHLDVMRGARVRDIAEHLSGRLPVFSGRNESALDVA
jgi:thioesterase domain-containing protein